MYIHVKVPTECPWRPICLHAVALIVVWYFVRKDHSGAPISVDRINWQCNIPNIKNFCDTTMILWKLVCILRITPCTHCATYNCVLPLLYCMCSEQFGMVVASTDGWKDRWIDVPVTGNTYSSTLLLLLPVLVMVGTTVHARRRTAAVQTTICRLV
jgi:hypothetical protein